MFLPNEMHLVPFEEHSAWCPVDCSILLWTYALLQYLSPLGWEHINLTGDYLWRSSAKIGEGRFRPLRPLTGS